MWREATRSTWKDLRGWPFWLLLAWLVHLLAMPITGLIWGPRVLYPTISLNVLLQATLSVALFSRGRKAWRTVLAVAIVLVLSWAIEAVGSATGVPFGAYSYTDRLQPQVAHVPVLIPAAWMMMLPPAWAVGRRLSGGRSKLAFILLSGLAFAAWDLFLDPQMVQWELWVWEQPGGYFGIPWINFGGWFLGAALITAVTVVLPVGQMPAGTSAARQAGDRSLMLVYALTWILEACGLLVFWGLPGPALGGFVGMGVFAVLAWRSRLVKPRR